MSDADVSVPLPPKSSLAAGADSPPHPESIDDPEPDFSALETLLGHAFHDPALLRRAVTHASSTADKRHDNERMEFLGDSILALAVCEHLFQACPDRREGELTEIKSAVVSRDALAVAARAMDLRRFLLLGRGIRHRKELPSSVLANAMEALIAALYLDAGYAEAKRFVLERLGGAIAIAAQPQKRKNFKSLLQQELQKNGGVVPEYRVLTETGPDHDKVFEVAVRVEGEDRGRGLGASKKEAEQAAAQAALETLATDESAQADSAPAD